MIMIHLMIKGSNGTMQECHPALLLWAAFAANLGGNVSLSGPAFNTLPISVMMFAMALVGTVFWISYRAGLTSGLSVEIIKPPFTTLEEFYDSDFR